jgi:hypothetical protein
MPMLVYLLMIVNTVLFILDLPNQVSSLEIVIISISFVLLNNLGLDSQAIVVFGFGVKASRLSRAAGN